jgi:hypothetical protein
MNNQVTHILKSYLLYFIGLILLYVLAWNLVLRKTIDKYQYYTITSKKNNALEMTNADVQLMDNEAVDDRDGSGFINKDISNEYIFNNLLAYCNLVKTIDLVSAPNIHEATVDDVRILTNIIELRGEYFDLMDVVKMIESTNEYGLLTNLQFYKKSATSTTDDELYLRLTLQVFQVDTMDVKK